MAVRNLWLGATVVAIGATLSGCASEKPFNKADFATTLPAPDSVVEKFVEPTIKPSDKLSFNVWPRNDVIPTSSRVDAGGNILLPPLGTVIAQGKTPTELAEVIKKRLADCCLLNPQVDVIITETVLPQINVTGAVAATGLYDLRQRTTLTGAISLAKGPDRTTANLKSVLIQRTINGQRMGALFNLEDIRAGRAEDPEVFGGDIITVESSQSKSAWRNAMSAVPLFGVFTAF